jgi:tetratricopeptide (TPR) repeat protein
MALARLEDFLEGVRARDEQRAKENEARRKKGLAALPAEREELARAAALCDEGCKLKSSALADPGFAQALAEARGGGEEAAGALEKRPSFEALKKAMAAFKEAMVTAPRLARGYFELAACNLLLGRLGAARTLLDEAALNSPNSTAILTLLGEVLVELGQWEEAARAFTRVVELEPESGRAHFGLARAYAGWKAGLERCRAGLDNLLQAQQLGLRDKRMLELDEQLVAAVREFERGGQPAGGPRIRGSGASQTKKPEGLDLWRGTLMDSPQTR